MQRVPFATFGPSLEKRLEAFWGKPVNLYRALGNHPAAHVELADDIGETSPKLP